MKINVKIQDKGVLELIKLLENPMPALLIAGTEVKTEASRHYIAKNKDEPNRLGGKRTNYWTNIARSIEGPFERGTKVVVNITDPTLRQKIYGGTIKPKDKDYLTIPLKPETHGVSAEVFSEETGIDLFFVQLSGGSKFLAGKPDGKFELFYLLKQSITQDPWPGALPEQRQLNEAAKRGAVEALSLALSAA